MNHLQITTNRGVDPMVLRCVLPMRARRHQMPDRGTATPTRAQVCSPTAGGHNRSLLDTGKEHWRCDVRLTAAGDSARVRQIKRRYARDLKPASHLNVAGVESVHSSSGTSNLGGSTHQLSPVTSNLRESNVANSPRKGRRFFILATL